MVANFAMRTYGANQVFRFVECIWLHRKSRQIRHLFRKGPFLHKTCGTCSEPPSYISTLLSANASVFCCYVFVDHPSYLVSSSIPSWENISLNISFTAGLYNNPAL